MNGTGARRDADAGLRRGSVEARAALLRQERGAKVLTPAEPQLLEVDEGAETALHVRSKVDIEHHDTAAEACQTC